MPPAPLRSWVAVLAVASTLGFVGRARADAGVAPTISGSFVACTVASDCASGHCVDGVCCDTACNSPCHSCALPGSPGTCTAAPRGSDPRAECAAAGKCTGTCDGAGACTASFDLATCGAATCTGNAASAAPVCAGGTCGSAGAGVDCGAYACAPAFGACRTVCATSADCAAGHVCNSTSKACVAVTSGQCSADGTSAIAANGDVTSCAPYVCFAGGLCSATCTTNKDCATGYTCDASTRQCGVAAPASGSTGGGCATGTSPPASATPWLALGALGALVALGARARRARR